MDEIFNVKVRFQKEITHPNTTEHHIRWIDLFFHLDGEKFSYLIGHYEFNNHGESINGLNESSVYTHHAVTTSFKTNKPGIY